MARRVIIYAACEPGTTTVRYIGRTIQRLHRRMKQHLTYSRNKAFTPKNNWFNSLAVAGMEPEMMMIRIVDEEGWQYYEQFYISYYRSLGYDLVNKNKGGQGNNGWTPSGETLERMRTAARKRPSSITLGSRKLTLGLKASAETRKRISASKMGQGLGQKRSPETRAKLSAKAKDREEKRRQERIANGTYVPSRKRPVDQRKPHLTAQQRAEIRAALSIPGARRSLLAKQYGVSIGTIRRIHLGLTFRTLSSSAPRRDRRSA